MSTEAKLLKGNNTKTIDIGTGKLTASIAKSGTFTSINTVHQEFGYITLTAIEQFPNDKWYDSQFVRQYRNRIANNNGFGIVHPHAEYKSYGLVDWNKPIIERKHKDVCVTSRFFTLKKTG
jgi:hypothetical protein